MTLNQRTIAEIKSYNNPIAEIHTCMRATLLLLGHPEEETKVNALSMYTFECFVLTYEETITQIFIKVAFFYCSTLERINETQYGITVLDSYL